MDIVVPRDRDGEFEPKVIPKHQREWRGFDDKILAMYSHGMSTQGIQAAIKDIYNADISPEADAAGAALDLFSEKWIVNILQFPNPGGTGGAR
jgi:hypothetical protein